MQVQAVLADASSRDDLRLPTSEEIASLGDGGLRRLAQARQREEALANSLEGSAILAGEAAEAALARASQTRKEADLIVREARDAASTFAVAGGVEDKRPILLYLTGGEATLATVNEGELNVIKKSTFVGPGALSASIKDLVAGLDRQRDTVVILVSPEGVPNFTIAYQAVREQRLSVGWDVAPPNM